MGINLKTGHGGCGAVGQRDGISPSKVAGGAATALGGLGIWTPRYPSADMLFAALFDDPPADPLMSGVEPPAHDPADMWPQMVQVISRSVRQWKVDCSGCPVIFATTKGDIRRTIGSVAQARQPLPKLADDAVAMADACGLTGEVICISTACASSLAALCEAQLLLAADASIRRVAVITADVASAFVRDGFESLHALAGIGVRPFDQSRGGLLPGSAAAWCYLEHADESQGELRLLGWGLANDAAHLTAPDLQGRGLQAAIVEALASARKSPTDIDAIIAHGTGTAFSDAMEAKVFAELFPHRPPLAAVKGVLGHTLGASGLVELAIAREMLSRQQVPAVVGLNRSDYPGINPVFEKPLRPPQTVQTVLKTASGFGGINAAVIVGGGGA